MLGGMGVGEKISLKREPFSNEGTQLCIFVYIHSRSIGNPRTQPLYVWPWKGESL
jgi:hypothetical protein